MHVRLQSLYRDEERYRASYLGEFAGHHSLGDAGIIDDDGYVHVLARTDDVINVAGHRLSTGHLEQCLSAHPAVAEAAVVGADDALKGQVPIDINGEVRSCRPIIGGVCPYDPG